MNSPSIATAIRLPPRRRCPPRHTSGLYACPGVPLCRRDLCAACGRVRWIGFTWMPRRVDGRDSTRLSARNPLELGHKYFQRQPRSYIGGGGTPEARMHPAPPAVANKDKGGPPSSTFDRDRAPLIPVLSRRAQHGGRKRGPLHALVFASTLHERKCRAQDSSSRVSSALRVDITLSPTFARGVAAVRQRRRPLLL